MQYFFHSFFPFLQVRFPPKRSAVCIDPHPGTAEQETFPVVRDCGLSPFSAGGITFPDLRTTCVHEETGLITSPYGAKIPPGPGKQFFPEEEFLLPSTPVRRNIHGAGFQGRGGCPPIPPIRGAPGEFFRGGRHPCR